jgi:hypothetical protein
VTTQAGGKVAVVRACGALLRKFTIIVSTIVVKMKIVQFVCGLSSGRGPCSPQRRPAILK